MIEQEGALRRALTRAIWLAAAVFLAIWFLNAVSLVLFVFIAGLIMAAALNPPVTWLERHRVPRVLAMILVVLTILIVLAFLGWLMVPQLVEQVATLVENFPEYARRIADLIASWLPGDTAADEWLGSLDTQTIGQVFPALRGILVQVGRYSLSLLGVVVFLITLVSVALYTLANPRPLLHGLLRALPARHQAPTARALARGSQMVGRWVLSNVTVGGIEAVAVFIALTLLGVPGAIVWAALAFFSELVPRLGPYIMAIPPIIVALAVSPLTAVWVLIFFVVLNQVMSNAVDPVVRGSQMQIHPVVLLFAMLAFGVVFGLLGALVATPFMGFIKAFYEEFYLARKPAGAEIDQQVEDILDRRLE